MKWFAKWLRGEDVAQAVEAILDTKLRQTVTALGSVDDLVVEKIEADEQGKASFALPIPNDAAGERLITVGVIDAALTADCTVTVKGECERADINGDGVVDRFDLTVLGRDFRNPRCQ